MKNLYSLLFLLACGLSMQVQAQCTVDAGTAQTVCSNQTSILLDGSANDNVTWTTSGTGYFDDPYSIDPYYYASATDVAAGSVTLTLTNDASTCTGGPISGQVVITILTSPTLSVGTSESAMCASDASTLGVALSGQYSNATSFTWSTTGTGTFVPNASSINNNYTPSAADISSGSMLFTATAVGASCNTVSNVTVSIIPPPTVTATDFSVCSNNMSYIYLYVNNPDVVVWSGGGSGELSNEQGGSNDAWYYPSTADQSQAFLSFTATATGACGTATDQLTITIDQPITVDAGVDQYLCIGSGTSITLNGSVLNTSTVNWYGGDGTFSDLNSDTTVYTPGTNDMSNGFVLFQLDGISNGFCSSGTDYTSMYAITALTVNAGTDFSVCALQNAVTAATTNGVTSFNWSSSGTGTWINQNKLDATYIPSAADRASGTSTLTLLGSGVCPDVFSNVNVSWLSTAVSVDAGGPYGDTCLIFLSSVSKYDSVALNGSFVGLTGPTPTSWILYSGTGYTGDPYSAQTYYFPGDKDNETPVRIVLTGYEPACGTVTDTATIIFHAPPRPSDLLASNSPQFGVCKGDTIDLGSYYNTESVSWSSSGGTGSFFGSTTDNLSAKYVAGANDQNISFTATYVALTGCPDGTSTYQASIHAIPTVNAGSDTVVCAPNNTFQLYGSSTTTNPSPSLGQTGQWDQPYNGGAKTASNAKNQGNVYFYDNNDPNTLIDFNGQQFTTELYWTISEEWSDMSNGNWNKSCYNSDTMTISYLDHPEIEPDTIIAQAGIPVTKNLISNDYLNGLPSSTILTDFGSNFGMTTFDVISGDLTYLNQSVFLNGRDTLRYRMTNVCGSYDTIVVVKLVNGPPFTPDTAVTKTTVQRGKDGTTTITLNLSLVFADYNQNLAWSKLTLPAYTDNGASITPGTLPYLITLTYSSGQARGFTGVELINFNVCDTLDACFPGKYYIEILPDYENPAVEGEDFVVINAVSPNGDGVNDFMYIYGINDYKATVTIYNRWNQKVWELPNYDNINVKFDGNYNQGGNTGPLPEGTYFYVVKNESKDLNDMKTGLHSGYIELRR